jgi:hypothetical protein
MSVIVLVAAAYSIWLYTQQVALNSYFTASYSQCGICSFSHILSKDNN